MEKSSNTHKASDPSTEMTKKTDSATELALSPRSPVTNPIETVSEYILRSSSSQVSSSIEALPDSFSVCQLSEFNPSPVTAENILYDISFGEENLLAPVSPIPASVNAGTVSNSLLPFFLDVPVSLENPSKESPDFSEVTTPIKKVFKRNLSQPLNFSEEHKLTKEKVGKPLPVSKSLNLKRTFSGEPRGSPKQSLQRLTKPTISSKNKKNDTPSRNQLVKENSNLASKEIKALPFNPKSGNKRV